MLLFDPSISAWVYTNASMCVYKFLSHVTIARARARYYGRSLRESSLLWNNMYLMIKLQSRVLLQFRI